VSYSTKANSDEHHPFLVAAKTYESQVALAVGKTSFTYSELLLQARQLHRGSLYQGIEPGARIALGYQAPRELIISIWACMLGGYVAFPLNTRFPKAALANLLTEVNPALTIANMDIPGHATLTCSNIHTAGSQLEAAKLPVFKQLDAASLLMTSGSSGKMKLVQHSHLNHIASARGSNQNIHLGSSDSWLLSLPPYHVGGLSILFRTALAGAGVVVPDEHESLQMAIEHNGVTHISLVPTQLQRLIQDQSGLEALQNMKAILLGGSAIPTSLIQDALNHDLPIHVSYGSTEMASQVTTTTGGNPKAALSHSGKLLPGRDLIISHEGEILVRGDTLAQGYLTKSTLTELRDQEGWFHTGDIGYVNVKGELTVTGRLDNQFISGGENIQPEHIEGVLGRIPGIVNALVIPRDDIEFGARPVAFLQMAPAPVDIKSIDLHLRKQLPGYMVPVAYFELPVELTGDQLKLNRSKLSHLLNAENKHLCSL